MTIKSVFDNFIRAKELANLSPVSIVNYKCCIELFIRFLGSELPIESLTQLQTENYQLYLVRRRKPALSKSTVATYCRYVRVFLTWASKHYELTFNPALLERPKPGKKSVYIYSADEIKLIFDTCISTCEWLTARNHAMIALMLDSGLRLSEVCNLERKNISFSSYTILLRGKGSKMRRVPLGYYSRTILEHYFSLCPYPDSVLVFVNRFGGPCSDSSVKTFLNRLKHKLPFPFSAHLLRHNFATNFCVDSLERTGNTNVPDLSILLGHTTSETTKIYEHYAREQIAASCSHSHLDMVYNL